MYVAAGVIGSVALLSLVWRFASRRRSIPCPVWLSKLVELDNPFAKTSHAAVIVEHLALRPGMKVIDVGCGPGRVTIPVAQAVGAQGEVIAVDIQAGMLARARAKAQAANLTNIRFVEAGAGAGNLAHLGADRVLLVTVLGEIPDPNAALLEIYDALVPGGILSITELVFDPHFQTRSTVTRLTTAVGFRETAFFGNRLAYTLNLEKPS